MLILTRKLNESVIIDGRIAVKVLRIDRDQVKLGIVAPTEVGVHRWEIFEAIQAGQQRRERPGEPKKAGPAPGPKPDGHTPA
jgi:carbon storage regulator